MKTYLVTGATRGIGAALVKQISSSDPSARIIVGVRDSNAPLAKALLQVSKNIELVRIDSNDDASPFEAATTLAEKGLHTIDVIYANAGVAAAQRKADSIDVNVWRDVFTVNAVAPLLLYQAFKPFLQRASAPQFIVTSTIAGSIAHQSTLDFSVAAYGASKAAVNLIVARIAKEEDWLTAFVLHPGLVADTDMAIAVVGKDNATDFINNGRAITSEESAKRIVALATEAKHDSHTGKFFDVQGGGEVPW